MWMGVPAENGEDGRCGRELEEEKSIYPVQYIFSVLHKHKTSRDKVGVKIKP